MAKEKKVKKKSKGGGGGMRMLLVFGILSAAVFLPSTILLTVGMLPTVVAFLVDRTRKKAKAVTIGALNLAGCSLFLAELWQEGHDFENAFDIITDPTVIIIMYSSAAVGYMIDWSMGGIVANVLYQKGLLRQKAILARQEDLVERWGREVTGDMPLDEDGFPIGLAQPTEQGGVED